jgi:hypothetical protein
MNDPQWSAQTKSRHDVVTDFSRAIIKSPTAGPSPDCSI